MKKNFKVTSEVWLYPGMAGWHFVTVDARQSKEIREMHGKSARGFGAVKVEVTLGTTTWLTSIFPEKRSKTYLLPLKASVRTKEGIRKGDTITFAIKIV